MSKIKLLAAASATVLSGAAIANAQTQGPREYTEEPSGFYLSGGYTYIDIETDSDVEALDDIGEGINALNARAGYQITPLFGVEIDGTFGLDNGGFDLDSNEIDLGELDMADENADADNLDQVLTGNGDVGLDYLVGAYATVGFPVSERFHVIGRVGYALAEVDNTYAVTIDTPGGNTRTITDTFGGSDDGFAFGAGAEYTLNDTSGIRGDYTRYNFGEANADAFTISYVHHFGGPGVGY
ncbi:outer membrane beta-barrel protein [Parvularcula dongshanensis]|uniref:Opacity protein-like surface antigen n=1 Tax=Parvularcula dongshanensis TaxID=1173995 RepID=A0A840I360_9PROT|nr:outer membrane beta-barrel protein [Parvularcula dongshanensis]MBB4658644.1 opacity protein-like surface antigen [Parvularcula dongshanensis]